MHASAVLTAALAVMDAAMSTCRLRPATLTRGALGEP
jgi:hypothetical protein